MTAERPGPPRTTVRVVEMDGDLSLFDSDTGSAALLNATAAAVWRLLDGRHTIDDIVAALAAAYRADPETVRGDVRRAVDDLTSSGFLA